jgi:ActR/RegA family two-component response regulator
MTIKYHKMREVSKQKARELVRKVLKNTEGNVSKTARILQDFTKDGEESA